MAPPKRSFVAQDFRVAVDFRETREARRLERKLGADGLLGWLTLQGRVAVEAPDGRLTGWDASDVGEAARCECPETEFLEALLSIGLLHLDGETLVVSDWAEAQPFIAESGSRRASAAKAARSRWDAARMRPASEAHATRNAEAMRPAYDPQCGMDAPTTPHQANHTKPTNQTADPNGSCVPQAAHAASAGVDALNNHHHQEQSPNAGQQEPQEQASTHPQGQRHPLASDDGLAGPSVELSTGYPQKAYPDAFEALWKSAPQVARTRSGKPKAYAAWNKAIKRAHPEAIASGLEAFKVSWDWRKDAGAFVPGLHIWLGREVWDERPPAQEPHAGARGLASGSRGGVTGGFTDEFRAKLLERIEREKQTITVEVTDDRG